MTVPRNTSVGRGPPGLWLAAALGLVAGGVHACLWAGIRAAPPGQRLGPCDWSGLAGLAGIGWMFVYAGAFAGLHAAQLGGWARWGRLDLRQAGRWAWTLIGFWPLPVLVLAAAGWPPPHALHSAAGVVLGTVVLRAWPGVRLAAGAGRGVAGAAARLAAAPLAVAALTALAHSPNGDEPHYLRIARSLAMDGDLELANQLAAEFPGRRPDAWPFHGVPRGTAAAPIRRSQHLPGLAVLLLPGTMVAGRAGAVATLWAGALGCCALMVVWATWWGLPAGVALAAALLIGVGVPGGPYAAACFPEVPAALGLLVGALGARSGRWRGALATAVALSAVGFLNARYIPPAAVIWGWGAWRARRSPAALAPLVALPLAAAVGWFWLHQAQYGAFDPRSGYGVAGGWFDRTSPAIAARAVGLLLAHPQVGLLALAPVWIVPAALAWGPAVRRHAWPVLGPAVVTLGVVATAIMSWDGSCSPPGRLLVAVLPLAAPWLAAGLAAGRRSRARAGVGGLVAFTALQGFLALANPSLAWSDGALGPPPLLWRWVAPTPAWLVPAAVLALGVGLAWGGRCSADRAEPAAQYQE